MLIDQYQINRGSRPANFEANVLELGIEKFLFNDGAIKLVEKLGNFFTHFHSEA